MEIISNLLDQCSKIFSIPRHVLDPKASLYSYGIDSLSAVEIQAFISEQWNVDIAFEKLLEDVSIEKIAELISQAQKNYEPYELTAAISKTQHPLAYQQRGIWLAHQTSQVAHLYNVAKAIDIHHPLDHNKFIQSLALMCQRHSIFRTTYHLVGSQLFQEIHPHLETSTYFHYKEYLDIDDISLRDLFDNEVKTSYQLDQLPLFRVTLIKRSENKYTLLLIGHHLIVDLWSFGLFINELFQIYENPKNPPQNNSSNYTDYIHWQHEYLKGEHSNSLKYWTDQYNRSYPLINLPIDSPRPTNQSHRGKFHNFSIPLNLSNQIKEFSQSNELTPFITLLSTFFILLYQYARQENICIGTTTTGRHSAQWHSSMGCFSNPIPLQIEIFSSASFLDFTKKIKRMVLEAFSHATIPFNYLVEHLNIPRNTSSHPMFNTMFVFQQVLATGKELAPLVFNSHHESRVKIGEIEIGSHQWQAPISLLDLTLYMAESNFGFIGSFEYAEDLFQPETISHIKSHYLNLLAECLQNPEIRIDLIDMRSEAEFSNHTLNSNRHQFDFSKTLTELFAERVKNNPHQSLIHFKDIFLSVESVEKYANQLAHLLSNEGIGPGAIVAIYLRHSPELVFSVLAILKLGASFLPIDPKWPKNRIETVLEESQAQLIITDNILANSLHIPCLNITKESFWSILRKQPVTPHPLYHNTNSIAYLIYTSGSTGKPKGVCVSQKMLMNYLFSIKLHYEMDDNAHIPLYSSIAFDLTITSLFLPLIFDYTLHIYDPLEDILNTFTNIFNHPQITHVKLTPAHLKLLVDLPCTAPSIQLLIVGGEQLPTDITKAIYQKFHQKTRIINEYGPTEATIGCIFFSYPSCDLSSNILPIGFPIYNTRAYILNHVFQKLPINAFGELAIAGDCLSYGYLNRPDLTAERFLPDPDFNSERMYITGDLAQQKDQNIFFSYGRTDRQIKVRGFRLEVDEIESSLKLHPQVKECIVVPYEVPITQEKQLCAYIVLYNTTSNDISDFRLFLGELLPYYMIPDNFIFCPSIPLTINGKIDLTALPRPDTNLSAHEYVSPTSATERSLVKIWSDVLGCNPLLLGITDHFFNLGGDSIKAIQIVSRAKTAGLFFSMADLFNNPTIKQLCPYVRHEGTLQNRIIKNSDSYPLSPIQKWFFENYTDQAHHYNQAIYLLTENRFDLHTLKTAFNAIINNHEALRSNFPKGNNEATIRSIEEEIYTLEVFDFIHELDPTKSIFEKTVSLQKSLNIHQGPLIRLALFRTTSHDRLLIIIHHLIIDGISWRILLEDFSTAYRQLLNHQKIDLLKEACSYQTWANCLTQYAQSDELLAEIPFWKTIEEKANRQFLDRTYNMVDQKVVTTQLTEEQTKKLLTSIHKTYHTQINDVLLAALAQALYILSEQNENIIHLEMHGREEFGQQLDISQTVGWFTSLVPIILPSIRDDIKNSIRTIKEILRKIPSKGLGYKILCKLSSTSHLKRIQPNIAFNYLGEFHQTSSNIFQLVPIVENLIGENLPTPYQLQLNCLVIDNKFLVHCSYDSKSFTDTQISSFVDGYKDALSLIIDHCYERKTQEFSPSDFLDTDLSLRDFDVLMAQLGGKEKEITQIAPLSSMQEGLLYQIQRYSHSSAYFEQVTIDFEGDIEFALFKAAFEHLIDQHSILRTGFFFEGLSSPRQVIFKTTPITFNVYDISNQPHEQQHILEKYKKEDILNPFSLQDAPLMRFAVFICGDKRYQLVWSFHHIILDGWSLSILFRQWLEYINAKINHQNLKSHSSFFVDYVLSQRRQNKDQAITYWNALLEGYDKPIGISPKTVLETTHKMKESLFTIDSEMIHSLQSISKSHHVSPSTLWHVIWGLILMTLNNCHDVVFGSVFSGRESNVKNAEHLVGLLIQTLPIRISKKPEDAFADLLINTQKQMVQHEAHAHLSLAEIQSCSSLKSNLFSTLLVIENYPFSGQASSLLKDKSLPFQIISASLNEETHYDFSLTILPGDLTQIKMQYNSLKYDERKIQQVEQYLQTLIHEIVKNHKRPINELCALPESEHSQLIYEFNSTYSDYPREKTVHQIFEEQVAQSPDATALVFEHEAMTYKELNRRADLLAGHLSSLGLQLEDLVGIHISRSPERFIAWLAVMKAGGAYVPLDPSLPQERIDHIIQETKLKFLLVDESLKSKISITSESTLIRLCIDSSWSLIETHSKQLIKTLPRIHPSNLAYVLYTSGSTGQPKGITIEHRSVCNHLAWIRKQFNLDASDRMLHLTSFSFDVSLCEFYALLTGGVLILAPDNANRDILSLETTIKNHHVTFLQLTPALLNAISHQGFAASMQSVRQVLCGADILQNKHLNAWFECVSIPLANLYGLTETCIDATYFECSSTINTATISIGKPLSNMEAYVLDDHMNLLPIGANGELYLAGLGLARGYFNNPILTATRFLPHPFQASKRIYKTGDIAHWSFDGCLFFLGREDGQIKVRGMRIELKEIEQACLQHPCITDAVIKTVGDGEDKELCSYLITKKSISIHEVNMFISKKLPYYMIPKHTIFLDKFPITPNGKIDSKALPLPIRNLTNKFTVNPQNELQKQLLDIWSSVLKLSSDEIPIDGNFFDLGGNSISIMQAHSLISHTLKKQFPIELLFEYPTIQALATYLEDGDNTPSLIDTIQKYAVKQKNHYLKMKIGRKPE